MTPARVLAGVVASRRSVSPSLDARARLWRRFPRKIGKTSGAKQDRSPCCCAAKPDTITTHLLIVLGPTPVGLFFAAVMATAPTEDDIWRAIDRLGRKYRVSEFIDYYLKAGRHLESEATSTLQEQWALARRNSITAHNRWQTLSLEIELALRGEAVDGLFRNATSLTVAEQAALLQSGWKLSGFDWLPTVDEATGNVVQFSKGQPHSPGDDDGR
jgi:hypothetical protein